MKNNSVWNLYSKSRSRRSYKIERESKYATTIFHLTFFGFFFQVSQWYVFNDFGITTITITEATAVHPTWKIPCILFYQSKEMEPSLREVSLNNPITSEVFLEDKSLAQRGGRKRITFIPLGPEEMPKVKDLVAIDAEFVTLNQEESELRSDGKVSTIKAAQMYVLIH